MDYEMILRFGVNEGEKSFVRIPNPLACFRRHIEQKTRGYDDRVDEEHRKIAVRLGLSNKLTWIGLVLYVNRLSECFTIRSLRQFSNFPPTLRHHLSAQTDIVAISQGAEMRIAVLVLPNRRR